MRIARGGSGNPQQPKMPLARETAHGNRTDRLTAKKARIGTVHLVAERALIGARHPPPMRGTLHTLNLRQILIGGGSSSSGSGTQDNMARRDRPPRSKDGSAVQRIPTATPRSVSGWQLLMHAAASSRSMPCIAARGGSSQHVAE